MARARGSFDPCIMEIAAAKEAVAGELKTCTTMKRKADECLHDEPPRTAKKSKVEEAAAVAKGEDAPAAKKLTRLPRKEVAWILAQKVFDERRVRPEVRALRRLNRDLWPSPEEQSVSQAAARCFIENEERFFRFQAWVRGQYDAHGYVEVDDDFLAGRAKVRAACVKARDEAFKTIDFSGGDEDLKEFFMKLW
jgi:uncharacterized protein with GYD domain